MVSSLRIRNRLGPELFRRDWTDDDLARRTGIGRMRINRIKNGRTEPTVKDALLIASVLGMSVREVFPPPKLNGRRDDRY